MANVQDSTPPTRFSTAFSVSLEPYEVRLGEMVGRARHDSAIASGRRDRLHKPADSIAGNIAGALAEVAVAKWGRTYWSGSVSTYSDGADVDDWIQVRSSHYKSAHLLVHADDRDDQAFVLVVTACLPVLSLRGWLWGREAKRPEWQRANTDHWVPQSSLRPMAELAWLLERPRLVSQTTLDGWRITMPAEVQP